MFRTALAAAALAVVSLSMATPSKAQSWSVDQYEDQFAEPAGGAAQDRLLIVNGNTGRVVYDDGRNDLFCVTRRYVAYYNYHGVPMHRRTMRCR